MNTAKVSVSSDRLTIRIDAYLERFGEDPFAAQVISSKSQKDSDLDPYVRKMKVTETLTDLILGDIPRSEIGYILLSNITGTNPQKNPSPKETEEISKRIVMIDNFMIYPYGMPFLAHVGKDSDLKVRCLYNSAILRVTIFPK